MRTRNDTDHAEIIAESRAGLETGMNSNTASRSGSSRSSVASLMAALDTLVVSTALSTIRLDLGASIEQLEWTVNAYNLSFAVLLMTAAALGDRLGRRRMFAVGLACSSAASAACALAPDDRLADRGPRHPGRRRRAAPDARLALLSTAFPPSAAGSALGIFSAITGIAVASGPVVGGAIVEGIAWQWIFWLNVPIGLLAIPLASARMRSSARTPRSTSGAGADHRRRVRVVWGLVRGNSAGWGSLEVVAPSPAAALLGRLRRLGAARARADAADALLPLARLLRRQRGDLLHLRVAVRRRVLLRAVPADRLGYGPLEPACGCCRGPRRSSSSRRSPAPWSTASASGRSWSAACCCRRSGWAGSR